MRNQRKIYFFGVIFRNSQNKYEYYKIINPKFRKIRNQRKKFTFLLLFLFKNHFFAKKKKSNIQYLKIKNKYLKRCI